MAVTTESQQQQEQQSTGFSSFSSFFTSFLPSARADEPQEEEDKSDDAGGDDSGDAEETEAGGDDEEEEEEEEPEDVSELDRVDCWKQYREVPLHCCPGHNADLLSCFVSPISLPTAYRSTLKFAKVSSSFAWIVHLHSQALADSIANTSNYTLHHHRVCRIKRMRKPEAPL